MDSQKSLLAPCAGSQCTERFSWSGEWNIMACAALTMSEPWSQLNERCGHRAHKLGPNLLSAPWKYDRPSKPQLTRTLG